MIGFIIATSIIVIGIAIAIVIVIAMMSNFLGGYYRHDSFIVMAS